MSVTPGILDGELFKIIPNDSQNNKENSTQVIAECISCGNKYRGALNATGNFYTHIKRKHLALLKKALQKKEAKYKNASSTSCETSDPIPAKQSKLTNQNILVRNTVSKEQVIKLVLSYIINEMRPLATVEKPSFKNLISGISNVELPTRKTLKKKLEEQFESTTSEIKIRVSKLQFVCTTADIWSCTNRSFMGVTCHYLDDNLKRNSCVLACRRMKFAHTHIEIAKMLSNVHQQFGLSVDKIVGTVTDNASNFGKAFRIFSFDKEEIEEEPEYLQNEDDVVISEFELPNNFDDDLEEFALPTQYRCVSHTLNLIATTDSRAALSNTKYKKLYNSSFAKANTLWNTIHRSTKAADIIEEIAHTKLQVPCPTRCNSSYDAICKLLSIKSHLNEICDRLDKPKFKMIEIEFFEEYVVVMKSLACTLDLLQGENYCYLGYVLPALLQLTINLQNLHELSNCEPLKNALIDGINKRFRNTVLNFDNACSKHYIISSVTVPKFKLKWLNLIPEAGIFPKTTLDHEYCKNLLITEAKKCAHLRNETRISSDGSSASSVEDDQFFKFLKDQNHTEKTTDSAIGMEVLSYLSDKQKDIISLTRFPHVKHLFLKFNTIIPSSAPVERLFSTGGQILIPRRNRLSDDIFEAFLMCKTNE
ncbi:unnamed protein product [Lasius platythorax]|uniref:HAT C-terminal dimerisation domain-containing protein n=2 Tax=Lasius TaxID=488720 RepID=A0AAV2NQF9_9HYME